MTKISVLGESVHEFEGAVTVLDVLRSIDPRPAGVISAKVNGTLTDLSTLVSDGSVVEFVSAGSPDGLSVIRHSTAHVMAQAVLELYPGAKYAIGPSITDGFYYDFELPENQRFTDDDLLTVESKMREIMSAKQPFTREELSYESGLEIFSDQPFKTEIIKQVQDLADEALAEGVSDKGVSVYRNADKFVDLCRGPHVGHTGQLGHFKLLRVAGAYWRGDEKKEQLQRIYGTAWSSKAQLEEHLHRLKEAEKRDHRRIGSELDLFHFPVEIGGGLPVFHPKGAFIRYQMEEMSRKAHIKAGYQLAWTPHIAKSTLYEISGHLGWYKDGMYPPMEMEGATYYPKPMNCPMHILIFRSQLRSYKELPLRLFEFGTVYRFERSGVLHGLARVRGLTQDDSHIFCAPSQLAEELTRLLKFVLAMLRSFGLKDFEAELATRPDKSVGEDAEWEEATLALQSALEASGIPYVVAEGEGAFYAPKIDVHLKDAIGRRWQVSTLQVDLQMPQRFDMNFVDHDNQRRRPYMIHRALFGSVERFFAILLEHYAGALPMWLLMSQIQVLPVRKDHEDYAQEIVGRLAAVGARAEVVDATEPLGSRIRKAKLDKIPYILVVGDDDVSAGTVGVNRRGSETPNRGVPVEAFVESIKEEILPPDLLLETEV